MNGRSRYNRNGEDDSTEEERFSSTDDGEYDDDGDDEDSSGYDDDDDDDDDEMQAFISPAQTRKAKQAKWALLRKESRLKPLEILHTTTARRIAKAMHPHDDVPDSCGCRLLYLLVVLGLMWGAYCWSGYEMSSDSVIQAWHQFRLRDIKHWCLDPKSEVCKCANPLEPTDRIGHKTWQMAHIGNVRDAVQSSGVDIVFLGDSITEGWRGTSFGAPSEKRKGNIKVFKSFFSESKGGDFEGLALGIAGDKSPNLLWRIQNGEVPDSLRPSVWWILIGTNDFLLYEHCSPDVVLMGIKRVVEEMRKLRPGSIIVVNSILPRTEVDLKGRLFDAKDPDRITLWTGIMEVNRKLRLYCDKFRNVVFYDATSIFLKKDQDTRGIEGMYIPKDLMEDYVHPTKEGYKQFGAAITLAVHQLIDASAADEGRKPLPHSWWEHVHDSPQENLADDHHQRTLLAPSNTTASLPSYLRSGEHR